MTEDALTVRKQDILLRIVDKSRKKVLRKRMRNPVTATIVVKLAIGPGTATKSRRIRPMEL